LDTRWKSLSHSVTTKVIVFFIVIVCFTSATTAFLNVLAKYDGNFDITSEASYYHSREYIYETNDIFKLLTSLIIEYKNEENILNGGAITEEKIKNKEEQLFLEFRHDSKEYNYHISKDENYKKFQELYADKISKINDELIKEDLKQYNTLLQRLKELRGVVYYATDGENVFTNSPNKAKGYFKSFPSYFVFDKPEEKVYPEEIRGNKYFHWITDNSKKLDRQDDIIYIGFTNEFLNPRIKEWNERKEFITESLYEIIVFLLVFIVALIYLIWVLGRKSFNDKDINLNFIDKLYVDLNLIICALLITLWVGAITLLNHYDSLQFIFPITLIIGSIGLLLVLSIFKHIKNKSFFKHSLISKIIYRIFTFFKDIYGSGSVAVKVLLIIIGYPLLTIVTINFFPISLLIIGIVAWISLKKINEFNALKAGVERIKNGDIYHKIELPKDREFGKLAANINSITDGLNKAVENELKSERLKTELITNVSHDIRTPLTSIITYVDLLKKEEDIKKREEYIEIIEQKANRLKNLTEDLFEASKASSGNIPVNLEKIDIVSLITQGLGELNDKIEESQLEFKLNHPKEKIFIEADGRLLWRAIENLLSNIFKYAMKGSRVYIDIEDLEKEVILTIKNISAYELNISADELMERFKRGDEARSSDGSGLGLSIAKSLINIQKGNFNIEIDGDLFKAIIRMPK